MASSVLLLKMNVWARLGDMLTAGTETAGVVPARVVDYFGGAGEGSVPECRYGLDAHFLLYTYGLSDNLSPFARAAGDPIPPGRLTTRLC